LPRWLARAKAAVDERDGTSALKEDAIPAPWRALLVASA
jgi:hypothetical protein